MSGIIPLRLTQIKWEGKADQTRYVTLLFEHVNQDLRSFAVVDTTTYKGREIEGEEEERGATAAHVVIQVPPESALNLGKYRCVIEVVSPITRTSIERFFSRQIRRKIVEDGGWIFPVTEVRRRKPPVTKEYKYTPLLQLVADVGSKFSGSLTDQRILTGMVFTKRKERQTIGRGTDVVHEDVVAEVGFKATATAPDDPGASVLADVEYRVSAQQGPADPAERQTWLTSVRGHFEERGYETKLYFRHAVGGPTLGGEIHPAIAGAADLLICPREVISFATPPKQWRSQIDAETVEKMKVILQKDTLWERAE